jgi:hypothetical protein
MSDAEESKSKEAEESKAMDQESNIANEIESEMEGRDEDRRVSDRAEREDLNQGMETGTHDSTRSGVKWGSSYTIKSKAKSAKASPGTKDPKDDSGSKV